MGGRRTVLRSFQRIHRPDHSMEKTVIPGGSYLPIDAFADALEIVSPSQSKSCLRLL
eukprot:CAMPEP_0197388262 /NCGR_PEP_ID=MMETSP1165-20131217/972_1 /TAXON_ID=284809 /ORGANISM="Chrysocystis fragilis, Strain CCMP3189" /LENGTH=56 /DNA_ID=CAMNT_0042913605 /DNA_START=55 /DNA_END=225 /DNA_ORIENTATION=+